MSAAVAEIQRDPRAPAGRGNDLLETWANWTRGGNPGEHHEWSVRERLDRPHDDVIPDTVMRVDRIVARIGVEHHPNYLRMIRHYWLGGFHPWQIAGNLKLTEGFVWLSLRAVADLVDRRFEGLQTD